MRNGRAYQQVLWAPAIKEIGGGLLRTPTVGMVNQDRSQDPQYMSKLLAKGQTVTLAAQMKSAQMLPTPRANSAMTVDLRTQQGRPELQPNLETVMARMLPTPPAGIPNDGERPETWLARRERVKAKGINGNGMGMPLAIAAQLLPTPTVNDAGNSTLPPSQRGRDSLPGQMLRDDSVPTGPGTHLNPSFVEEMMGFPVGWTVLKP